MPIQFHEIPEDLRSLTAQEIHAELCYITHRSTPVKTIVFLLGPQKFRLYWRDFDSGLIKGPLKTLIDAESQQLTLLTAEQLEGLRSFITHCFGGQMENVDTHLPAIAKQVEPFLILFQSLGNLTTDQHQEFHAAGGGLKFPNLTVQQVQEALDAEALRVQGALHAVAIAELWNESTLPGMQVSLILSTVTDLPAFKAGLAAFNTAVQGL